MIVLALSNADLDGVICDDLKVGLGGWSNYAGFVNAVAMVSNCTANYVQFTGDKGTEGIYDGKGNSFKIMWNMTYLIDWIKLM